MKFIVIGSFYQEAFASHIAENIEALGYSVHRENLTRYTFNFGNKFQFYLNRIFSIADSLISHYKSALGINYITRIKKNLDIYRSADIILITHDYLSPAEINLIKKNSTAKIVLWYPDPIWSFGKHQFINANYDFYLFKDPYLVLILKNKLKLNAFYLPECFNSLKQNNKPQNESSNEYDSDICTAGNLYSYRVELFKQLQKYDVKIYGLPPPLWMDVSHINQMITSKFIADEIKGEVFNKSKIVLNSLNPAEIYGINARAFEICGFGAFQLIDWRPGLSQLFNDGIELVSFTTIDDLKSKINFYLENPDLRKQISYQGYLRVMKEHTYQHRIKMIIDIVNLKNFGYQISINNCIQ